MAHTTQRAQSRFVTWLNRYGVRRLERALQTRGREITSKAIYDYASGRRDPPGRTAIAIVEISGGELGFGDLYPRREELQTR